MEEARQEKLKMTCGAKKASSLINAEMDFHLNNTDKGRTAGTQETDTAGKRIRATSDNLNCPHRTFSRKWHKKISYTVYLTDSKYVFYASVVQFRENLCPE